RRFGNRVYYGDASRQDILDAAGADEAEILVLAVDDPEKSLEVVRVARRHFPNMEIIARARNRKHAVELMELGVVNIHREMYLTSLEVARQVMLKKGRSAELLESRLATFKEHDERLLTQQFELRGSGE